MATITKNKKTYLRQFAKLLAGLLMIVLLFYYFGFEKSMNTLLSINPKYIILAYIIHSTSWLSRAYRLKAIFSDQKIQKITKYQILKINFAGYTLNILLPFKLGDIARMYMFHTETKLPLKPSITSVIYTRIFDLLTLCIFGIISLTFILNKNPAQNLSNYIITFLLITSLIIILTSATIQKKIAQYLQKKRPKLAEIITSFILSKKCRILSFIYSTLIWSVDGITIYLIFKGLNQEVSLPIVFMGLVIGNIVKSFPTTPGGIGLFEGSMALLFISLGINQNIAIVTSTIDHFIKNTTTLIFGIPSLMSYKYDIKTLKDWSKTLKKKVYNPAKKEIN